MKKLVGTGLALVICTVAAYGADGSAAFEKLKALAGTWKGKGMLSGSSVPMTVIYKVTAAGHTVQETIDPGGNHEMVTMYYLDGKSLVLTHYCSMGNQPHMKLGSGADASTLKFDFDGGGNIKGGDGHMHSASIKFVSENHIQNKWYAMMGGKEMFHVEMDLTRSAK